LIVQDTPETPDTSEAPDTPDTPDTAYPAYTYGIPTIIPAAPGTIAIVLHCDYSDDKRPTIEDVSAHETFVIAWRIVYDGVPTPILIDRIYGDDEMAWRLRLPDGRVTWPGVANYANLDDAKEHYLQDHQYLWDAKHFSSTKAKRRALAEPSEPTKTDQDLTDDPTRTAN